DGHQLSLIKYPRYLGLDTSKTAIELCRQSFAGDDGKRFMAYQSGDPILEQAEMAVSLDVIYHLLEDAVYDQYMSDLFSAATRLVVAYSSDTEEPAEWPEVRHRNFTAWVADNEPSWRLARRIPNRYPYVYGDVDSSWADFFIFEKRPRRWWHRVK
ncbi:MAG: glycosyltransferase, partial [Acidimicrobiia bacterium]